MWLRSFIIYILTSQHHTMTLYDSCGTHHVIKCTRPPKILPRVIITYGACARGGGRRPGFEASHVHRRPALLRRDSRRHTAYILKTNIIALAVTHAQPLVRGCVIKITSHRYYKQTLMKHNKNKRAGAS